MFSVDRALVNEIAEAASKGEPMERFKGRSTLKLIQSISTIPCAFPPQMNTCGRICVHKSGRFVIVSNRGHESIAIFRIRNNGPKKGELISIGYFHTRGETPRHFQFDASGQYIVVANQDSDSIAIFSFNLSSGEIKFSGNEYRVPSPNFVCCCALHDDDESVPVPVLPTTVVPTVVEKPLTVAPIKQEVDSDMDSEDSTVPTSAMESSSYMKEELAKAHDEIAELRRQLSNLPSRV